MSLPTPSSTKPSQSAITSFFQPRQPRYAPPPSQSQRPSSPDPTPDAQLIAESESRARREAEVTPASDQPSQPPTTTSTPPPILLASPSASSALPREAFIRPLTPADIPALKRINSLLLPVAYPEPFYAAALASPFSRAITWSDSASPADAKLVGAIVCRLEPLPGPDSAHALYIQSLALLSPYRAHGLATAALADLVALAAISKSLRVAQLTAHVWTDNDDGLAWYAARGFSRDPLPIPGYYLKLRPNTAYLVRRDLSPLPLEPASAMGNAQSTPPPPPPGPSVTAAAANMPPFAAPAPPTASSASLPLPQSRPPPRAPSSQSQRSGQSFQNKRAETEWNDLPVDMMGASSTLAPPPAGSGTASEASSRSSSTVRKKKERKYAAAAFGS